MMAPFMVEIVFCRVTRRGRKRRAGMNKAGKENMRNDGPSQSFIPPDNMVKLTLDLSDNGPVFSALDEMMMKMSMEGNDDKAKGKGQSGEAKNALKNLLKSGIPGIESMFGGEDPTPRFGKKGSGKKGFHKMNDQSKKKFMAAIFGPDGTQIDSSTAAALLAATCSGGNPEVGNRLAELLVPNMDEKIDPTMMAALMSACSLINAGAGTEEVMNIMKMELAASGMSEEEILAKAQLLMKAFGKEDTASTAEYKLLSKQKNKALVKAEIPPKDFTAIVLAHKAIAACGVTPENCAKLLMILSTLAKKGANPFHLAQSMKNLGALKEEVKAGVKEAILKAWDNPKITKNDVMVPVRMHQALDNENEPGWAEVKQLKDIVGGCAPSSPEAIELNLARAVKSGGMKNDDIGKSLMAFKCISSLGVDPMSLAKIMFLEKDICGGGVPGSEVGRVLTDGIMPPEATQSLVNEVVDLIDQEQKPADIEATVNLYNNLKFKSNIPSEVIEFVDKSLIQVRCSLEDVTDNMISSLAARGEKQSRIVNQVTDMLKKTGATALVTATTMMAPLVELTGDREVDLTRTISRNLKEVEYETEEVKSAMTEVIVKIIEDDPSQHADGVDSQTQILKDFGMSLPEIKDFIAANLPPPPTPPEEVERRRQIQEELERLEAAEKERERLAALKLSDPEAYEREVNPKPVNKGLEGVKSDSRRGSLKPGDSRRGSFQRSRQGSIALGSGERRGSLRSTVAMVTDDPQHKQNVKTALAGAFDDSTLRDILGDISPDASEEEIAARLAAAGIDSETAKKMVGAVKSGGMSPETRALMEQVLASGGGGEDVSGRVAALLAGTSLTTSKGVGRGEGREVETVEYEGANLSDMKPRKDTFEMPQVPLIEIPKLREGALRRGSIKRQSEIVREKKKSRQEEREEEKLRQASYFRKVTGLRKAKVPLMVYSCGGFSRCFRIARFYDLEGPPVGVEYARPEDERKALNPEL